MTKSDDKMKEEIIMSVVATQVLRRSTRQFLTRCALAFAILTLSLILTTGASAADKPVPLWLFDVGNTHDGNSPIGGVIADKAGNLYGTTQKGGFPGFGIVLKLTPTSSGLWKETILHTFQGSPSDGATPDSTLVLDSAGNLYGTTLQGGLVTKNPECSPGCGLVFKLTPTASGPWKETIIHRFTGKLDGANPVAGLIQDSAGNLFGSAAGGGTTQLGVAFELSPTPTGWKETVLHNFGGTQGAAPFAPLAFDSAGDLYGTTLLGGNQNLGVVFKLTRQKSGLWKERVLHNFQGGSDGLIPLAGVVLDKEGNVFGASQAMNGQLPCGTVFKLTAANGYAQTILHEFEGTFNNNDGCIPNQLVFDSHGNLFGTSEFGGTDSAGTIFKLTRETSGFSYKVLYSFLGDRIGSTDGEFPVAPLTFGPDGALFSTSLGPGFPAGGEVFKFIP
jgi:outer membrane protein assembly factor BamB